MGLALDEPRNNDEHHEEAGVPFLLSPEISRWVAGGVELHVDYNKYWKTFTVRAGNHYGC